MPSPEPRTIAEAIDASRDRLRGLSPTPWLDARLLAQHITGLDASAIIAYGDSAIDARRKTRLFELTERRARGEPVAYIVGRKSFCGLEIAVDPRALVPRPETEELVQACLEGVRHLAKPALADIGTGSGAIACALAHFLPDATITASDVSADALELAAHNAQALGFADQISFVRSDLFADYEAGTTFDAIVANLPYVASASEEKVDPHVAAFEPQIALEGGPDGLAAYRRLLEQAPPFLRAGGSVYLECAPGNAAALEKLAVHAFPGARTRIRKDIAGLDRIVIVNLESHAA
ncbi:MAG TPA: peptide chain release factor N(5)-glutamine methyltransferase [Candidatus Acidoferrales bacterium]|nr:peptide chain release factor N(5)-glutamine methyltransferase [Candidatus Acidoferrales bacterium]